MFLPQVTESVPPSIEHTWFLNRMLSMTTITLESMRRYHFEVYPMPMPPLPPSRSRMYMARIMRAHTPAPHDVK